MNINKQKMENEFNWDHQVSQISESFRFNDKERASLRESKIAKLIGVLPFLSSCENQERTSLRHLATYIIASRGSKDVFYHNIFDNNDVLSRLYSINTFVGGDKLVIEKGMKLLALNMVHNYLRDIEEDSIRNKYNPIASGVWNYKLIVKELEHDISKIDYKEMDEYFNIIEAPFSYWGYTGGF